MIDSQVFAATSTRMHLQTKLLGVLSVLTLIGCTYRSAPQAASERDSAFSQVSEQALLEDVMHTLNRLDETCVLDLTPPELVLDATKSRNRKEVLVNFAKNTVEPNSPYNLLEVVSRNGQFDRLKIGPKDQIRLFVDLGEDKFGKLTTVKLVVRSGIPISKEHIEPNRLIVENNPFEGPLPFPVRMEIWRYSSERMRDLGERIKRFHQRGRAKSGFSLSRNNAPKSHQTEACWEPAPDEAALETVVERLNQWARGKKPQTAWQASPLIDTLPESYQIYVQPKELADKNFNSLDVRTMQEDIWARDIGEWAAKDARFQVPIWGVTETKTRNDTADLESATALFDWTIRHIQLLPNLPVDPNALVGPQPQAKEDTSTPQYVPQQVWHTLLMGRGTNEQRAWVFTTLARQQKGLNVVTLAVQDKSDPKSSPKIWASALLLSGQLYLFDPTLGLPLPGPGGKGIATLEQVLETPEILRQLDLSSTEKYPITSEELTRLVALVVSSPLGLSERGKILEEQLVGNNKFFITGMKPKAIEQIRKIPGITDVRLWDLPYRMLDAQLSLSAEGRRQALHNFLVYTFQPWLYKARVMHFQGKFDAEMIERVFDKKTANKYGDFVARYYYRQARPADKDIKLRPTPDERLMMLYSKVNASYWLGLLALDDSDYRVAKDFFAERTLAVTPGGPWTHAAHYNLGRTDELLGENESAIEQYELDAGAPQGYGNRIRARWLSERHSPSTTNTEKQTPTTEKISEENKQPETSAKQPENEKPKTDQPATEASPEDSEKAATQSKPTAKPESKETLTKQPATQLDSDKSEVETEKDSQPGKDSN